VSTSTRARKDTLDLISGTESGLNNIKRTLESVTDKQTAEQIRTFLQKAKAALELDDLDGAHTLATKAKVLLDELTKQ
jgi:phosphoribosylformimino-5-aminoimidazole carboxamide ribonucleotide (ProFAR) isomerase